MNGLGDYCFESEEPLYFYPDPNARDINDKHGKYYICARPTDVEEVKRMYPAKKDMIKADISDLEDIKVAKADADERAFWVRTIERGKQEAGDLDHAIALLHKHGALDATRAEALAWAARSKSALYTLPDSPLRQMLIDLADYVVARIN